MLRFISSSLSYIENAPVPVSYFSDTTKKFAKIAGIAFAVLSALTALFYIYRNSKTPEKPSLPPVQPSPKLGPKPIPTPLSPNNPHTPDTDPLKTPITKDEQWLLDHFGTANNSNKFPLPSKKDTDKVDTKKSTEMDDLALARKLQEEEDAKVDQDHSDDSDSESDRKSPVFIIPPKPAIHTHTHVAPTPATIATPKAPTHHLAPLAGGSPFRQIEDICSQIGEKAFTDTSFSAVKALAAVHPLTQQDVVRVLNKIVVEFESRHPMLARKIAYGDQVPAYFANVVEQRMEDRLYLSLAGIRNLAKWGAQIIDDFRDTRFLGGEHHYLAGKGLSAFRYATGNVVDLDTEIDAKTDDQAIKMAESMIVKFGELCGLKKSGGGKLTAADVITLLPGRKLNLPQPPYSVVHSSISNVDRNNYGVWKYTTVSGKVSYYVNVPNTEVVLLATLRLPYMLAELAYRTEQQNHGNLPKDFFDEFFTKGLSDKCFNDKARTFVAFYHEWSAKLDGVLSPEDDARKKNCSRNIWSCRARKRRICFNASLYSSKAYESS